MYMGNWEQKTKASAARSAPQEVSNVFEFKLQETARSKMAALWET